MKNFRLIALSSVLLLAACGPKELVSPDKGLSVQLFQPADGSVMMRLSHDGKLLMDSIGIGLKTDRREWKDSLKIKADAKPAMIGTVYTMVTGKRIECRNNATECTYSLTNAAGDVLSLHVRAYDDGLAFQYILPEADADENILAEYTSYSIPEGTRRWMQNYEPAGYEAFYPQTTNGQKISWRQQRTRDWGYPALIHPTVTEPDFMLITEANIRRGHCGSYMNNDAFIGRFDVRLADEQLPVGDTSWESPWRLVIAGTLADIVESTLVTDVADPSKIEDASWIEPGPVAWIYWANNHGSQDYKIVTEYMDLAKAMGWKYNLIDAEWDLMKNGGNIEDALAYSREIGVKSMIWYNSSTNWVGNGAPTPYWKLNKPEDREKEFTWLNEQGVVGTKVDFFRGDKVEDMDYYIDLMESAAAHKLMINFHGATIPRGWQRTYPNMMSVEGVYGAEWYNNGPTLTPRAAVHNATLPFTRNVVGPMDYTPGTFTDSQHEHITTHGHELALTVLFESALQHMPDRPSAYLELLPDQVREFLSALPTAWFDTKLLAGYPGDNAVIARRYGDTWYIAGINGTEEARDLTFSLERLEKHGDSMWIARDGDSDREFKLEEQKAPADQKITIPCRARGGFVIKLN